jgi:hypothetical protein
MKWQALVRIVMDLGRLRVSEREDSLPCSENVTGLYSEPNNCVKTSLYQKMFQKHVDLMKLCWRMI